MKKLFTMLALAIFTLSMVGCEKKAETPDYVLSANKTSVAPGEQISFTITGATTEQNWQICGAGNCYSPLKFTNGQCTVTISEGAIEFLGEQEFYGAASTLPKGFKTNLVKVTIVNSPK